MKFKDFKKKIMGERTMSSQIFQPRDLAFEIGLSVWEARIRRGLTQEELAQKVGTKQPSIARLENGSALPSLLFLEKIAKALGLNLTAPSFDWQENVGTNIVELHSQESLAQGTVSVSKGIWNYDFKQVQTI